MKRVIKTLEIIKHGIVNRKYDCVIGVFGEEGTGKSYFDLTIIEEWLKSSGLTPTEEDIKYMNLSLTQWSEQLAKCQKFDINVLDEGGKLSSKRVMTKLNQAVSEAYQIIRGDNLFSIITLPSLWELDTFFTRRRMRGAFFVYKRGKVAFWDRRRLRKIIAYNENRLIKNMWVVKPNYHDHYPDYKGVLLKPYLEKKKDFMKDTRRKLAETIADIEGTSNKNDKLTIPDKHRLILEYAAKHSIADAVREFGVSKVSIHAWKNKYKSKGLIET